jgi:hypothetical protein
MEIEKFSVRELTTQEQLMVNGGSKLGEFLAAVWDGIKDAAEWVWDNVKITVSIEVTKGVNLNLGNKS